MPTRSQQYVQFIVKSFNNIIQEISYTKVLANTMLDKARKICKAMIDEILDANKCRRSSDEMPFGEMSTEQLLLEVKNSLIAIEKMIPDKLWWTKKFDGKYETKSQFKVNEAAKNRKKNSKLIGKSCHIDTIIRYEPKFAAISTNERSEATKNTNQQLELTTNTNQISEPTHKTNVPLDLSSSLINSNDGTIEHSVDGHIGPSSNDISAIKPVFDSASLKPNRLQQIDTRTQQPDMSNINNSASQSLVQSPHLTPDFAKKHTKSVLGVRNNTMPGTKAKPPILNMKVNSMAGSKMQSLNSSSISNMDANSDNNETMSVGRSIKKRVPNPFEPSLLDTVSTAPPHIAMIMDDKNVYSVKSKNIKSEQSEITHVHMMPDHQILILRDTMATESKTSVKEKSVSGKSDDSQSVKDNISGQYTLYLFRKNEDTAFFNFIVDDSNEPVQVSGVELIDENGQPTIHLLLVLRSKAKQQLVMNYILVTAKRFKGLILLNDFQVGEPCYLRTRVHENSFDILLLNDRTSLICFRFSRTTIDWYNKLKDKYVKLKMLGNEPSSGEVIDFHHAKSQNNEPMSRVVILVQWPESEQNKAYRAMIVIATLHSKDSKGLLAFNVGQKIMLNQPTMDTKFL
jgi:hypothetical protein